MPTTISFVVDNSLSERIDRMIKKTGMYTSKSEFMRDAARTKLIQMMGLEEEMKRGEIAWDKLQKKARYQGEPTPAQRDEWAKEFLEKTQGGKA